MKISFSEHSKTGHKILVYTCADGRLFYYTGLRGTDKGTASLLSRLRLAVENLEVDYRVKAAPLTKAVVRKALDGILNKTDVDKSIFKTWSLIISKMQTGHILTPAKKRYSPGSIKSYNFTLSLLQSFGLPEIVTMDTYHAFITWCHEKDYSTNYIGSQIKNWKRLGNLAGIDIYKNTEFKKITEDSVDVFLDEAEIRKIYELPIDDKKMDATRDWFILDCFTGLRVCDLVLVNQQNFSKGFLTIANEKTDEKVIIPAHRYVKKIRIKHSGFPPPVSSHEINIYIKSICRSAGIDDKVLHVITKGGVRKDTYMKKYEMISAHTARRSFITNLQINGVPDTIIKKLTGIKSDATLQRYNKLTVDQAAKIAAGLKFFK